MKLNITRMHTRNLSLATKTALAAVAFAAFAVTSGSAHATTANFFVHGATCQAMPGGASVPIYSASNGVSNTVTSSTSVDSLPVVCPITLPRNFTAQKVTMTLYDRNQNVEFANCVLRFMDLNGNAVGSPITFPTLIKNQGPSFTVSTGNFSLTPATMAIDCAVPPVGNNGMSFITLISVEGLVP